MQEVDETAALPEHSSVVHNALHELMHATSADAGQVARLVKLWVGCITACSKSRPPLEGEVPREILASRTQATSKCAKLRARLAAGGDLMSRGMSDEARAALRAEVDAAEAQKEAAKAAYNEAKADVAGRFHQQMSDWQTVRPPEDVCFGITVPLRSVLAPASWRCCPNHT